MACAVGGGFFAWVRLADGVSSTALAPIAERHGVRYLPGPVCAPTEDSRHAFDGYARLCFAYEGAARVELGVHRLAAAVAEARSQAQAEEGGNLAPSSSPPPKRLRREADS